jgi:hypothetical protein
MRIGKVFEISGALKVFNEVKAQFDRTLPDAQVLSKISQVSSGFTF